MIAARLRDLREKRGLSQTDLAARSGLTKCCISHLERGRRANPHASTVAALAKALRVSPAALIEEKD